MKKYIQVALLSTIISATGANAAEKATNASDRYVYIGTEWGLSEPTVKSFKHKDSGTTIRLKQSHMYGGRIGYSFYPNMMVEFSVTHQPKYRLAYRLPEKAIAEIPGVSIPVTPGTTRVTANVYMLNFIYEMQKMTSLQIKPYAIFGAGVAQISVKPTNSYWKLPAQIAGFFPQGELLFFKIKKTDTNCFAWQVGAGVSKDLTDNFSVDLGAKMQVVNDIKIKYDKLTNPIAQTYESQKPIKITIGVGEFTMGLTYKFPM